MSPSVNSKREHHVRYCAHPGNQIVNYGAEAEDITVDYLVENLNTRSVGDFRILVNYTLPFHDSGGRGTLEIDLIIINRLGVFVIEVKDWRGTIEAFDGYWMQNQKYKHPDVFGTIDRKGRLLYSKFFGRSDDIYQWNKVSVTPLIVLFRNKNRFQNHSRFDSDRVVGMDNDLILALSTPRLLFRGQDSKFISDLEIQQISERLFTAGGQARDEIIRNYRILSELSSGELFRSFEGVHTDIPDMHVRIKAFQLSSQANQQAMRQIRLDAIAVSRLGYHPNILQTRDFFEDSSRPDMYYEITELPIGERLDEWMTRLTESVPLDIQIKLLLQLCQALQFVHKKKIYHRNLNPETIFIINGETIKIADFDYAKIVGGETISRPGEILVDNPFTAPELFANPSSAGSASDIFSLGVIWFHLACLPDKSPRFDPSRIDKLKLPDNTKSLMKKMTARPPDNRPQSIDRILKELGTISKYLEI